MENKKLEAVAILLNLDDKEKENLQVSSYDENIIEYYSEEYEVLTDDEADARWDEELDYYLKECIYPELPENMVNYFDNDAWKRDARFDGRGHAISRYDGNENVVKIDGAWYNIYRQS